MKKWMQNVAALLVSLNLANKAKESGLTDDEVKSVLNAYKETYGVSLDEDKKANLDASQPVLTAEEIKTIAEMTGKKPDEIPANATEAALNTAKTVKEMMAQVAELQNQVNALKKEPDTKAPAQAQAMQDGKKMAMVCGLTAHTAGHIFGIEDEAFSRGKWFNELTASRKLSASEHTDSEMREFKEAFSAFSDRVRTRLNELNANGLIGSLNFGSMVKGESTIDYSDLKTLAGEYVVRRTDLILAYFRSLPSVGDIFPVISNVQNKEVAPTASFGGLSQGFRGGRIFKGNVAFSAEIYTVDDMMFKYNFTNMKELEKQYIGYLNREGSDVIKWTFIEWIMVHFGEILVREQNERRVCGVRVPQQAVVANPANFGADGVLRAIERAEEALKVLPFTEFGAYNANSMLDTVEGFWDKLCEILPSVSGYKLYLNARHKQWYIRAYRTKYGQDADFTGSNAQLVDLAPENIVWVPNMARNCFKIFAQMPGNIVNLEFVPGEMNVIRFTPEFEGIIAASYWKEGAHVQAPGVKYASKSDLVAADFKNQFIFTNFPISTLTITNGTIDVSGGQVFELDNHATTVGEGAEAVTTPAANITTVSKFAEDQVIKFVAKAANDEITKAGAFSKLATGFKANAAGDFIVVYPEFEDYDVTVDGVATKATRPTGKFLELRKSVTPL